MKRSLCLSTLLIVLIHGSSWAQLNRANPQAGFAARPRSISIIYDSQNGNLSPFFSTSVNNDREATNGTLYNGGDAFRFKVRSDKTYAITLSSETTMTATSQAGKITDIRDYLFFTIVENTTGGFSNAGNAGLEKQLGRLEQTIITSCPATTIENFSERAGSGYRSFSLMFKLKAGYSIPPGSYITNLLISATYE